MPRCLMPYAALLLMPLRAMLPRRHALICHAMLRERADAHPVPPSCYYDAYALLLPPAACAYSAVAAAF